MHLKIYIYANNISRWVERRPVKPEENGADHWEQVRVVMGAFFDALDYFIGLQNASNGKAKVGAEHMHVNWLSNIIGLFNTKD